MSAGNIPDIYGRLCLGPSLEGKTDPRDIW